MVEPDSLTAPDTPTDCAACEQEMRNGEAAGIWDFSVGGPEARQRLLEAAHRNRGPHHALFATERQRGNRAEEMAASNGRAYQRLLTEKEKADAERDALRIRVADLGRSSPPKYPEFGRIPERVVERLLRVVPHEVLVSAYHSDGQRDGLEEYFDLPGGQDDKVQHALAEPPAMVVCDGFCGAYEDPDTTDLIETLRSLRHWQSHPKSWGCSHGC